MQAAPVPTSWLKAHGVWPLPDWLRQEHGLAVDRLGSPDGWARRCHANRGLAWALWSGLRALESGAGWPQHSAFRRAEHDADRVGLLGALGALALQTRGAAAPGSHRVRLAAEAPGDLVPGPVLEAKLDGRAGLQARLEAEIGWARQWLAGDEVLGLAMLCGPLSKRVYTGPSGYRRTGGYLDGQYGLSAAGCWRLCFEAGQGIGRVERRRRARLSLMAGGREDASPHGRRRTHLRLAQRAALAMYREGALPLGVEYSMVGEWIGNRHGIRADALLVAGERLVWVEVLKRHEHDLPTVRQRDYRRKREAMPLLAEELGREVEFALVHPAGVERWIQQPGRGGRPGRRVSLDAAELAPLVRGGGLHNQPARTPGRRSERGVDRTESELGPDGGADPGEDLEGLGWEVEV